MQIRLLSLIRYYVRLLEVKFFPFGLIAFVAGLLLVPPHAGALTQGRSEEVRVRFKELSDTLPASEVKKVLAAVDRVRSEDWCSSWVALLWRPPAQTVGAPKPSELTLRRIAFIKTLLTNAGYPAKLVGAGSEVAMFLDGPAADLILIAEGSPPRTDCSLPKNAAGFRE